MTYKVIVIKLNVKNIENGLQMRIKTQNYYINQNWQKIQTFR